MPFFLVAAIASAMILDSRMILAAH